MAVPSDSQTTCTKLSVVRSWSTSGHLGAYPCAEEAPVLEDGWQRYRDRVSFVGVDVQDIDADALAFIQKFHVTYPNGAGNAGPTSVAYGMRGVPESYFVARDGRIVRKWNGALSTAALERYLDEVQRAAGI